MIELTEPTSFEMAAEQAAWFAARQAGAVRIGDVTSSALRWLWPGRIPLGHVSLLAGDPGVGKSLATLDMAARITSGAPWPDETAPDEADDPTPRTPASVVLVTAEDALADTVRPRFEAMGGDIDRLLVIAAAPDDEMEDLCRAEGIRPPERPSRPFDLTRDFNRLRTLVKALGDCRLLIIDPITAYLGGTNESGNADIRQLLLPLAALARECDLAVVIVNHLHKRSSAAIYRTMGSVAFVAASRAAWALARDPNDPQQRLLVPLKSNFGSDTTGLAFAIESQATGAAPRLQWSPEKIPVTADEAINTLRRRGRPDDERQSAIQWLEKTLAEGPQPSREVHDAAEQNGFSLRTIQRAFREVNGQAFKDRFIGDWHWRLPSEDRQK